MDLRTAPLSSRRPGAARSGLALAVALVEIAAIGPGAHASVPGAAGQPALSTMSGIARATADSRERAARCLTYAIAYEAGREPVDGQRAVAAVILNRTAHPAYPKSICGVVFQGSARATGCQFTFTCDGALRRSLPLPIMLAARRVADEVLAGDQIPAIGGATHYHASYVYPYWAPTLVRVGRIGTHVFYRARGATPGANRWSGAPEPGIAGLASWLAAPDALTLRANTGATAAAAPPRSAARTFSPWGLPLPTTDQPGFSGTPE